MRGQQERIVKYGSSVMTILDHLYYEHVPYQKSDTENHKLLADRTAE